MAAMSLAADRDLVAQQYAHGYSDIWEFVLPALIDFTQQSRSIGKAIVLTQLATMARYPDSLIARKCGAEIAAESARRAEHVLASINDCDGNDSDGDDSDGNAARREIAAFDRWLRDDKHRRNPGTTADLLTAALFVNLRDQQK
jgi:triphosphoribosyl-dephospho-CoA synthase